MLKDQYGDDIPNDLVLMPDMEFLDETDLEMIDNADWYEAHGILMVPASAINFLSEDDPVDADINLETDEVWKIDNVLHRWSKEGFYHA